MISADINGIALKFDTTPSLFSPNAIDPGTLAMLSVVTLSPHEKVLDLGCGYGVVGIYIAKLIGGENVTMTDVDEQAVKFARENAALNGVENVNIIKSDGFGDIDDAGFTLILCNPPYHSDFHVARLFIEKGFNRLCVGGKLIMVVKRKNWYQNKLTSIFGGVSVKELGGYYVFTAQKRAFNYAKK